MTTPKIQMIPTVGRTDFCNLRHGLLRLMMLALPSVGESSIVSQMNLGGSLEQSHCVV